MEAERRIAKDGQSGKEVAMDRGGRQNVTIDGNYATQTRFTRPGKTH